MNVNPPGGDGRVRCRNRYCRGTRDHDTIEWKVNLFKGTFFEGARNGKESIMLFLWLWLIKATSTQIELFTSWSSDKVYAWTLAVQDLITTVVLADHVVVGGPGIVVEIDESKFGKRKYNKGHKVEGAWVFGGVELTPERKFFAVVVPDRTKETLHAAIKRHIAPGSIIRSDCWSAYINLKKGEKIEDCEGLAEWLPEMNYKYEAVNHSEHFVDPDTGVHTNTIEGTWFAVKRSVPVRQRTKKHLQGCLFEFIWRRRNEGNLWNGLMRALQDVRYETLPAKAVEALIGAKYVT
jgi:ISXO2-like transposase domain